MTKKPFKELMGTRIIIKNFAKEKQEVEKTAASVEILLLPSDQKAIEDEKIDDDVASTERFTILQVGEECNPKFLSGQEIYLEKPERVLSPENSEPIIEKGEILGFIIPERMVAGIF